MEKIDETRPLRWSDADLQPLWPKLRIRTALDDIDANHKNSRNRNDQFRCRPGQSVCDPAPTLIHTGRPDGFLDFFNERWLEYLGVGLEEVGGLALDTRDTS
jgi:hypothetical protein